MIIELTIESGQPRGVGDHIVVRDKAATLDNGDSAALATLCFWKLNRKEWTYTQTYARSLAEGLWWKDGIENARALWGTLMRVRNALCAAHAHNLQWTPTDALSLQQQHNTEKKQRNNTNTLTSEYILTLTHSVPSGNTSGLGAKYFGFAATHSPWFRRAADDVLCRLSRHHWWCCSSHRRWCCWRRFSAPCVDLPVRVWCWSSVELVVVALDAAARRWPLQLWRHQLPLLLRWPLPRLPSAVRWLLVLWLRCRCHRPPMGVNQAAGLGIHFAIGRIRPEVWFAHSICCCRPLWCCKGIAEEKRGN